MKTNINFITSIALIAIACIISSCDKDNVDPPQILDEVFLPNGYHQIDNPPEDALARLVELRLENTKDHYYYLKRENITAEKWIFPQKELKIEYVDYNESSLPNEKSAVLGVVVKKIQGNWKDEQFSIVESQPTPKDGMKVFYEYISTNLKYPEEAKKSGIEGKVFIEFVVDENGKLTNIKAVRGIGAGCDEEAIRVLKAAPNWNPAKIVDMAVKVRMILPITYKLD